MIATYIIGNLHPVILHLPIGILIFTFLLELLGRIRNTYDYRQSITIGLGFGTLTAIASCITGYLLTLDGDYQGALVDQHKWTGISVAVLSAITFYLHYKKSGDSDSKLYFSFFSLLIALLIIAGHKGGSITHGEGFLFSEQDQTVSYTDVNEAILFEDIILPIFNKRCNSCHNSSKAKGDLIMTSAEELSKGGEHGEVLIGGSIEESSLLQNMLLPLEDDNHMPPKSKPQPTTNEISLIQWWIEEGASTTTKVGDVNKPENILKILDTYKGQQTNIEKTNVKELSQNVIEELKNAVSLTSTEKSPFIQVDMSNRTDLNKKTFQLIKSAKNQIVDLNLARSNVNDDLLRGIKNFNNLSKLQLQKTSITKKGLSNLRNLTSLSFLNLYGTEVGDEIEEDILSLTGLQTLYLWQTNVTPEMVGRIRNERPFLNIYFDQQPDIFGEAALKPPLIVADKDFFSDSLEVSLVLNFKNVSIHYTLDGTKPDSLSRIYTDPFTVDKTTLVKAISRKENWKESEVASRQFVRAKYEIQSLALSTPPADKYKGTGKNTLIDFKKGTVQFTDGMWLGFEGKHVSAKIDLGEVVTISGTTISALEATGSWIFYPRGLTVSTSIDGSNFTLQKDAQYEIASSVNPPASKNFTESFAPTTARYLKIDIKSVLKNPSWHPAPGGSSWVFIDEIMVE